MYNINNSLVACGGDDANTIQLGEDNTKSEIGASFPKKSFLSDNEESDGSDDEGQFKYKYIIRRGMSSQRLVFIQLALIFASFPYNSNINTISGRTHSTSY